jgi:hypothetical protein
MIFTTVKKRVEKEELFPNDAVMTLVDNKFSLNKKAMELFGFPLNTANTSKIANGYDENNNIILSTMDTKDMYTNNVTAKNDFSSQLLATRLGKLFKLDTILDNHFQLNLIEDDGNYKYAGVKLIHSVNVPFQQIDNAVNDLPLDNIYEYKEEDLIAIETLHADEIAQQEEDIINSQSSCAEIISDDTKEEPVGSEQVIPAEIVKRVINTESW